MCTSVATFPRHTHTHAHSGTYTHDSPSAYLLTNHTSTIWYMDITKKPIAAGRDCLRSKVLIFSVPNLSDVLVDWLKDAKVEIYASLECYIHTSFSRCMTSAFVFFWLFLVTHIFCWCQNLSWGLLFGNPNIGAVSCGFQLFSWFFFLSFAKAILR